MYFAYHFPLKPSPSQVIQLDKMFNIGRNFWNHIVNLNIEEYKNTKKSLSKSDLEHLVKDYKKLSSDLDNIHTHIYQNIITRYCNAKSNSFLKLKKDKKLELPKFKNDLFLSSLSFKEYGNGCKIIGNKVKFNYLTIPFKKYQEIKGNIKTIQIKRINSKKFILILVCQFPDIIYENNYHNKIMNQYQNLVYYIKDKNIIEDNKIIGIDLGIEKLAVCSNGKVFQNPKHIKKYENQLQKLREKKKRQNKESKRYQKTCEKYRKKHEKVNNCRRDYLHRISKEIVLTCETIVIEDLNIQKMMKSDKIYSIIKKYISDASWAMLGYMLQYKSNKYGKTLIKVAPEYTSQICNNCGNIKKKELSEREHNCEKCGYKTDRDLNAAINIRERYKRSGTDLQ
jgi:putative transposase